jgi:hypothetical protein
VTDSTALGSVVLSYTPPGGSRTTVPMTQSNNQWSATMAAGHQTGDMSYTVTATDIDGRSRTAGPQSVTVGACPV